MSARGYWRVCVFCWVLTVCNLVVVYLLVDGWLMVFVGLVIAVLLVVVADIFRAAAFFKDQEDERRA